jgi:hypothetical protein
MGDPVVQSIIKQVKQGGLFGLGQEQQKTPSRRGTKGDSDWEDVEATLEAPQCSREEAQARRKMARDRALKQGNALKLSYMCVPDNEVVEKRPSGWVGPSQANIFVDTTQMRPNTF